MSLEESLENFPTVEPAPIDTVLAMASQDIESSLNTIVDRIAQAISRASVGTVSIVPPSSK